MEADLVVEQRNSRAVGQESELSADLLPGIGLSPNLSQNTSAGASAAVTSYVSLFLLMLVFFTVLFSIASFQHDRSRAILSSLDNAFAHLPSRLGLIPAQPAVPTIGLRMSATQTLSALFKPFKAKGLTVNHSQDGTSDIALGTEKLFVLGSDQLQSPARTALDRLAVFLQHPTGDERIRVTLRAGPAASPGEESPAATLAIARISGIAKYLFDKGAPPDAIAIALDVVPQGTIEIVVTPMAAISGDIRN